MKDLKGIINSLYRHHALIYKIVLFVLATIFITYLFPKGGQFKYEFQKGKPWQYNNLYAPFDLSIEKSEEELAAERKNTELQSPVYFNCDEAMANRIKKELHIRLKNLKDEKPYSYYNDNELITIGDSIINGVYKFGLSDGSESNISNIKNKTIVLKKGKRAVTVDYDKILISGELSSYIRRYLSNGYFLPLEHAYTTLLFDMLRPNISFDKQLTEKALQEELAKISQTKGFVASKTRIISKGDVVEGEKLKVLNSLKKEYESQLWSQSNYNWIVFGYAILVSLAMLMLFFFLKKHRVRIFENNTKITFILFNIVFMVFITALMIKYNATYVYAVPLCILPLVLKTFFDARISLFTHIITILLLGFIVPNSFEFIFLQLIAGIVTVLTISEFYKRARLFISVGQITLAYMVVYFAFSIIREGNAGEIQWLNFALFLGNGLLTLFSQPLIYIYEKTFGLVSDVSLLELSDTNSKLLRRLSEKAPGTFQHSLQVANLSEAAANEIGANAMLVRTGALYHDIGKMNNPLYFTENQTTDVNPHDEITPAESAKIIINHVIEGIEMSKKYKLPDRIIDFIRTHHGTGKVYYFYKKQQAIDPDNLHPEDYSYPGPTPFSRETAILMMCDAVEAASKSLKSPTVSAMEALVDKVIDRQMDDQQFLNADITFKEIQIIKKVLKKKLKNIYHLRVEYPS